jgi:hypothetical protein
MSTRNHCMTMVPSHQQFGVITVDLKIMVKDSVEGDGKNVAPKEFPLRVFPFEQNFLLQYFQHM